MTKKDIDTLKETLDCAQDYILRNGHSTNDGTRGGLVLDMIDEAFVILAQAENKE